MSSAILRKLTALVVPEGVLLLAVAVLLSWGALQEPLTTLARFYPYAVLAAGVLLAWRFHRSRMLYALVVLALADRAVLHLAGGASGGSTDAVFQTVAFLVPLNLLGLTLVSERGLLSPSALLRAFAIGAQVAAVLLLIRPGRVALGEPLNSAIIPEQWLGWTPVGQVPLLVFLAAFILLAARLVRNPNATGRGFLWALAASFLALNADRSGSDATIYFATGGLILVVATIEVSYLMAYRDGLTGLPARRALDETLARAGGRYTVAMVDVDHFKKFNDQYGHDVGDHVLRMVASKLRAISGGGHAFRYGGEEFALVFPGKTLDEALFYLEEIRSTIEDTRFTLRGRWRLRRRPDTGRPRRRRRKRITITVSIGAAEARDRTVRPDDVVRSADQALYRAKQAGRNRVET
ncbi:MAG: diguanylate cyclase [Gemmatimonadales bacterium]|nr:diguanylate cyclase [Gemmatimonadales bacterium]NIN10024.1 diguanylate cyclase [Gemmatimonadales bacterium]NIQ98676.1 diguanylate cyclase [Gemmatimonadales bacterium]